MIQLQLPSNLQVPAPPTQAAQCAFPIGPNGPVPRSGAAADSAVTCDLSVEARATDWLPGPSGVIAHPLPSPSRHLRFRCSNSLSLPSSFQSASSCGWFFIRFHPYFYFIIFVSLLRTHPSSSLNLLLALLPSPLVITVTDKVSTPLGTLESHHQSIPLC